MQPEKHLTPPAAGPAGQETDFLFFVGTSRSLMTPPARTQRA